jgi:hypothetical protein
MKSSTSLELAEYALLMFCIILAEGAFSGLIARLMQLDAIPL